MSILSGLDSLGLGDLSSRELYENDDRMVEDGKPENKSSGQSGRSAKLLTEKDYVFAKTYVCPVCDSEFKNPTIRSNKARLIGTDIDLRPRYSHVDPLKYDVICCPHCGFAALSRYVDQLTYPQARLIRETISKNFKSIEFKDILSYDDALIRYQLALGNAMVKRARSSEKAYICMKMAWVVRGKIESFDFGPDENNGGIFEAEEKEKELIKNALDGFLSARQNETPPICGMDNITIDYLMGALAYECGDIETAAKMVGLVLQNSGATKRMKDMARELKDDIIRQLKSGR
ncbi:MAG TPA: DUF2225 domain-containing protein [Lachnospiraceae bacterium]|nr:DUF2225 domain-containing protein [Lachnospiraceae bacterium]